MFLEIQSEEYEVINIKYVMGMSIRQHPETKKYDVVFTMHDGKDVWFGMYNYTDQSKKGTEDLSRETLEDIKRLIQSVPPHPR